MRVMFIVVALAGCGRFGFGENTPSDAGASGDASPDDAVPDAGPLATPQFCDDRVVTTLSIGALDAVAIRAISLGSGYAVAIETVAANIPLLELDANGAHVATHGVFTTGYGPLFGMSKHGDRPAVHLMTAEGGWTKLVDPGWETYTSGPNGDAAMIDPSYAEIGVGVGIAARLADGEFHVGLHDDNAPSSITDANYTPTTVASGSLVPVPAGARIVVEKAGGVCETFVIDSTNTMRDLHTFSPCYAPKVAAVDDTSGAIVHRTDAVGPYAVHLIPSVPSDPGSTFALAGATYARTTKRMDGAVWVGHGSATYRALIRITPGGAMTESRENTAGFYFDLTERDAFWFDGATVHVSTPCLR